jgi:class 3 adenylate cyclase/pimeloyl-ACP methyl ester carboxylesterase
VLAETKYAKSGDLHIAYQVMGSGPVDLVLIPGWIFPIEVFQDEPHAARGNERFASFSRLITLDKRGTGQSDRVPNIPTLEERMDDVRAVMDDAGSDRAVLFGNYDGSAMCALFAATYPERTAALILYGSVARWMCDADTPWGWTEEVLESVLESIETMWGKGELVGMLAPSMVGDPAFKQWLARSERVGASPGAAKAFVRMNAEIDVRNVLPTISVPTLVLQRTGTAMLPVEAGRYVAARIPKAKYVEFPGDDILPFIGDSASIADEIEEFVTGTRPQPPTDRILATVLFTDLVGSTEKANVLGDRQWRELLDRHDAIVEAQINRFRGRLIKSTGDGILATFDGPARAINCACAIRDGVRSLSIEIRSGLHTGEIEIRGEDVGGIAVNMGARVSALAAPGEVLVSRTVVDLVAGSGIEFVDQGDHNLKGVPGPCRLFAVESRSAR